MSQTSSTTPSPLERRKIIGGSTRLASKDGDDETQTDYYFSGGDYKHEEHDCLPANVAERSGERNKTQIDTIEHQFNTHEHYEWISTYQ